MTCFDCDHQYCDVSCQLMYTGCTGHSNKQVMLSTLNTKNTVHYIRNSVTTAQPFLSHVTQSTSINSYPTSLCRKRPTVYICDSACTERVWTSITGTYNTLRLWISVYYCPRNSPLASWCRRGWSAGSRRARCGPDYGRFSDAQARRPWWGGNCPTRSPPDGRERRDHSRDVWCRRLWSVRSETNSAGTKRNQRMITRL